LNPSSPQPDRTTSLQRHILLVGAVLIVVAVLFPPWVRTGGAFSGFKFLFLPLIKKVPDRVNSSLLFLELAGIALTTYFLFLAARHVVSQTLTRAAKYITLLCGLVATFAFAWFVWPRWFTETNGVRTHRITGVRYGWSQFSQRWLTEADLEAESRASEDQNRLRAKPVLDELKQIHFGTEHSDIDNVKIYNPTHWQLPYGETKLTVELYHQQNRKLTLLRISEDTAGIEPGLNDIYLRNMQNFSGYTPLLQKIKITASGVQRVSGDRAETLLVPIFQIEIERSCESETDPYGYSYKLICR